jgi:threonine synthase
MERLGCLVCRKEFDLNVHSPFCPECAEPLIVVSKKKVRKFHLDRNLAVEVFEDYLPLDKIDPHFSLQEGDTPIIELHRLRKDFGLPPTFAKNECLNPTASFKDRGSVVAVQKAVSLGFKSIGTISTGNMAGSTAAYAAKAGLKSVIFVKEDTTNEKIMAAGVYGPVLVKVRGDYGVLFRASFEIGRRQGIYFMNSVDPFRIEGYKATAFEIFLQMESRAPDYVIVPVSAGGHIIGLIKGFLELKEDGYLPHLPAFIGVQAKGCSPIARAFERKKPTFSRFPNPRTVAHAISNPNPPGGNLVLKLIRETGGAMIAVSDAELLKAQRLLADREGLFCDPASATVLAALLKLKKGGKLGPRSTSVLVITGSGLKTVEDLSSDSIDYHEAAVGDLETLMADIF